MSRDLCRPGGDGVRNARDGRSRARFSALAAFACAISVALPAGASAKIGVFVQTSDEFGRGEGLEAYDATGRANDAVIGYVEPGSDYFFVASKTTEAVEAGPGCLQINPREVHCANGPSLYPQEGPGIDYWELKGGVKDDRLRNSPANPVGLTERFDFHLFDGGSGDDVLVGYDGPLIEQFPDAEFEEDSSDETFYGRAGVDKILAGGGDGYLNGGPGGDEMRAQGDGSTFEAGCGGDFLEGGPGRDLFVGGFGSDCEFGNPGRDILLSRGGNDRVSGWDMDPELKIDCGGGATDRLTRTPEDPKGKGCETITTSPEPD
jgi:Ca2+-binding RTX toxin-like protein